jgi:predicted PurR-regulated permease PerM
MIPGRPTNWLGLEDKSFLLLLALVTMAFGFILWPLSGAILWGMVLAILFTPLNRALSHRFGHRRSLAAIITLVIIVVMVILPLTLIIASLVQEASKVYERIQSGKLDFRVMFQQVFDSLPGWAANLLDRFGLTDLRAFQERLSTAFAKGSQFLVAQTIKVGQNTFDFALSLFVMLYLLFFLLRDGDRIFDGIQAAIPLKPAHRRALLDKFTVVIRATVKGNVVVAFLQGALGGLIFWILGVHPALLWAVLMGVLSLLPAVGAALVWFPVAIYFLVTGKIWPGVVLLVYGVVVISLVDNFVRPILVGKDTRIPDYVVLISTLGGISAFGVNGFVIGPVIAALFIAVWNIVAEARNEVPRDTRRASHPD